MHMRSVTRKAAVTAGLGVALAAGAAGAAGASTVTDAVADLTPTVSHAESALPDTAATFPLTQATDKLPVGEVLTPGNGPLDHVAEGTARGMEHGMTAMADQAQAQGGQAKGGLGSPLGGTLPAQSPLDGLQGSSPIGNGNLAL
jgi:hypothetical protein